jgi:hypothetical protein
MLRFFPVPDRFTTYGLSIDQCQRCQHMLHVTAVLASRGKGAASTGIHSRRWVLKPFTVLPALYCLGPWQAVGVQHQACS